MKRIIFFLLLIVFGLSVFASEKIYTVLSRGRVKDNSTGLIWTRCSLLEDDKPAFDFNCKGNRKKYSWSEAVSVCQNLNYEGESNWRLPNVKEMQSIVFYHHYSTGYSNISQITEEAFPNVVNTIDFDNRYTNPIHYWTSTVHKNDNRFAWFVDFYNGNTSFSWRTTIYEKKAFVRCVAGP